MKLKALPIKPTPYLEGQDAREFERKLRDGLKNPTSYVTTPKLARAKQKLAEYISEKHKQV